MKRVFFAVAVFLVVSVSKALAIQDPWGSERPALWRSSDTCANENFVLLTTGPVHIHSIQITSATVIIGNGTDKIAIHNSTTSPHAGNAGNFLSSATLTYTWVPPNIPITQPPFVYDVPLSSGAVINKTGISCTRIEWDYISAHEGKKNESGVPHTFGVTP